LFTTVLAELSDGATRRASMVETAAAILVLRVKEVVCSGDFDRPTDLRDAARRAASTATDNISHRFRIEGVFLSSVVDCLRERHIAPEMGDSTGSDSMLRLQAMCQWASVRRTLQGARFENAFRAMNDQKARGRSAAAMSFVQQQQAVALPRGQFAFSL
jgi:hypothetical protein